MIRYPVIRYPRIRIGLSRRAWYLGPLAVVSVALIPWVNAGAGDAIPGGQGTNTALPLTESALTGKGRGAFTGLSITVNQTRELTNQAISITWTGGAPTLTNPGTFSGNFLQIMQCWGDDDGTVPGNPGPPPEQCVQGAIGSTTPPPQAIYPDAYAVSRIIGVVGSPGFEPTAGFVDTRSSLQWRPFRAVDGTVVNVQNDPTFLPGTTGGNSWLNPYFNSVTTNEIAGAKTDANGRGAELFEVHTGLESSGLGCAQKVQATLAGTKVPQCWIVIVPRGEPKVENAGTTTGTPSAGQPVSTSPMRSSAWQNRIAIPIELVPIDSPCSLAAEERRLAGSELVQAALSSWQPALCVTGDLPPFSFAPVSDAGARLQLATSAPGGPGMVMVSRPLGVTEIDPNSPVVYAPVALTGISVGFNVERNPKSGNPDAAALAGVRVAELNLTPRLVAKLLSQSYRQQVEFGGAAPATYTWLTGNPQSMATDPDFLRFNPEFELLISSDDRTFSGLQLPSGTSDAAQQVWEWVLADPEAAAWLGGQSDEWGMQANPVYSTDAQRNPTGIAFGTPVPQTFPKAEPYCFQAPGRGTDNAIVPPPLCGTDWMPYSRNFGDTAKAARIAFDGARIVDNPLAISSSQVWTRSTPQYSGKRMMLSLTDTPSATRLGLQMARLSRAGDNRADREFIAPTSGSLLAGVAAMRPAAGSPVLLPSPTAAPGAYPLTALVYAAIKPLSLDAVARGNYAAFLDYVAASGQVSGPQRGQLPAGYAPLVGTLAAQTVSAAEQVRTLVAPAAAVTTTTTTTLAPVVASGPITSVVRPSSGGVLPTPVFTPVEAITDVPVDTPTTTTTVIESAPPTTVATSGAVVAAAAPTKRMGVVRLAVPGMGAVALGSALGALEITKRARRTRPGAAEVLAASSPGETA